jgi:hypothetical protein
MVTADVSYVPGALTAVAGDQCVTPACGRPPCLAHLTEG